MKVLHNMRALAFATAFLMGVTGCAAPQAYREGNALLAEGKTEQGLAKLEEAVRLEPRNAEYRIALASRRAAVVNRLVAGGEAARHEGRLSEAEKAYRQALVFEAGNAMARQGLDALIVERRHRQVVAEAEALFKKGGADELTEALEKLRPVLSESPSQKDALNLKARIDERRVKLAKPEAKLASAYRRPITLEFRDAPLKSVFDLIAKLSGLNFFFDKDIRPDLKATILAKNTSVEDAVRLLLMTNQLEQKVLNENSVLVYPNTPQKLKEYQTLAVRSFYLANADAKAVSNTIKTIVKTKDLVIDERLGIIIMRDTPEAIRMAERIVSLQDLSDPEVMLEVEVMEIKRSRLLELGIQWPSQLTLTPLTTTTTGTSTTPAAEQPLTLSALAHLRPSTLKATIGPISVNARKEDQDGNILANPRIRVRNKEKAKILIGDRVPVITTTSTSTGFVSESVNYVDVGLKLEVEPNIYLDEEVGIKVNLEVSSLVREVVSKSGTLSYQIGTRGATTVLRLKDGETQILAGLISDEDRSTANKIPVVGELPIVGRLFGSEKDDSQRSEILLSITPRIVRTIRRPDLLAAEFDSGTEANVGAESLKLSHVEPEKGDGEPNLPGTKPASIKVPAEVTPPSPVKSSAGDPAPGTARGAPAERPPADAGRGAGLSLSWKAPAQAKAGEQFSAVLHVGSQEALQGLPLLINYDNQLLQVVSVQEGDFFKQNGGTTQFSQRVDHAQGKVFVAAVRHNPTGHEAGTNGMGGVVIVTFKALKPATSQAGGARIALVSASPEPPPGVALTLPVEKIIRILP